MKYWQPIILDDSVEPTEHPRASHLCICETCGKDYQHHQLYSWGSFPLYLVRTCDGKFWKL